MSSIELSIVMPCLDEASTVARCVEKALRFLRRAEVNGEVVVADNGSADESVSNALAAGARVVHAEVKGYGSALASGIANAKGKFVIMGDADMSYDFEALDALLSELRKGADVVIGNRFMGEIKSGAMPLLHRYLGNPVLSSLGRLFFHAPVADFHCGLRGFRRESILRLNLQMTGMEFASEMIVKAMLQGLSMVEVAVVLHPDGRSRSPHLRTWRDGWRHLRFLLLFSPRWLFLIPGLAVMSLGIAGMALTWSGLIVLGRVGFDIHTLAFGGASLLIGYQMIVFAVFTKLVGERHGWLPKDNRLTEFVQALTLERILVLALIIFTSGVCLSLHAFFQWSDANFGYLDPRVTMRLVIPGTTFMALGGEIALSAFFLEALKMPSSTRLEK